MLQMLSSLPEKTQARNALPEFAFLTSHGKTLLLIAQDPRIRMRDIAGLLHVTERATQHIVADLARAGYIDRRREGRRNVYTVSTHLPLGLPTQRDADIGALLAILPAPNGAP
jgi:DNA-binding MarR family transcriptional regulator